MWQQAQLQRLPYPLQGRLPLSIACDFMCVLILLDPTVNPNRGCEPTPLLRFEAARPGFFSAPCSAAAGWTPMRIACKTQPGLEIESQTDLPKLPVRPLEHWGRCP